jgi:serine/threonine protein kinase
MNGCIQFYGFTQVYVDESRKTIYPDLPAESDTATPLFALVFDYASEGPVLEYLKEALQPGSLEENWLIVCDVLGGVAEGLKTIHQKDVIHR